jgi:hypothetical protein
MGTCGAFSYSSTLAAFMSFTPASRLYSISTTNTAYVGTYTITITGSLMGIYFTSASFTLTVVNPCLSIALTPLSSISLSY